MRIEGSGLGPSRYVPLGVSGSLSSVTSVFLLSREEVCLRVGLISYDDFIDRKNKGDPVIVFLKYLFDPIVPHKLQGLDLDFQRQKGCTEDSRGSP